MANQPTAEDRLIDRRSVLRAGAALAAAGPALLHGVHAKAQPRPSGASPMTIIDAQVHAYAANTPQRPWHNVPNWPPHVTGDEMVAAMNKVGVDGAIYISPFSMYQYDASYAVEVLKAHPDKFALVKPVNPDDPAVAEEHQAERAEYPRRAVEEQAGLALGEAEVQQAVVDVHRIAPGDRDTLAPATDYRQARINDRNRQRQDRHEEGGGHGDLGHPHDGKQRQRQAQELGSGVPHENPRRMEVEDQEAQAGTCQPGAQDHHAARVGPVEGGHQKQQGDDRHHAGGQAVHSV